MKLVKFTQTTCQPCTILGTMLKENFEVEVDESRLLDTPELLEQADKEFGVMSTPTMILFDDEGKEVARTVGINPMAVRNILIAAGKL